MTMIRELFDDYQANQLRLALAGEPDSEEQFARLWERRYPRTLAEVRRELVARDFYIPHDRLTRLDRVMGLRVVGGVPLWYASDVDRLIADQSPDDEIPLTPEQRGRINERLSDILDGQGGAQ